MKILIVEDSEPLADVLMQACKNHSDHEVTLAKTLRDADNALTSFTPDIVLSDNRLPDGIGPSRFKAYRSKNEKVFICLLTGDRQEPFGHGADLFLHKPVPVSEIYAILTQVEMAQK